MPHHKMGDARIKKRDASQRKLGRRHESRSSRSISNNKHLCNCETCRNALKENPTEVKPALHSTKENTHCARNKIVKAPCRKKQSVSSDTSIEVPSEISGTAAEVPDPSADLLDESDTAIEVDEHTCDNLPDESDTAMKVENPSADLLDESDTAKEVENSCENLPDVVDTVTQKSSCSCAISATRKLNKPATYEVPEPYRLPADIERIFDRYAQVNENNFMSECLQQKPEKKPYIEPYVAPIVIEEIESDDGIEYLDLREDSLTRIDKIRGDLPIVITPEQIEKYFSIKPSTDAETSMTMVFKEDVDDKIIEQPDPEESDTVENLEDILATEEQSPVLYQVQPVEEEKQEEVHPEVIMKSTQELRRTSGNTNVPADLDFHDDTPQLPVEPEDTPSEEASETSTIDEQQSKMSSYQEIDQPSSDYARVSLGSRSSVVSQDSDTSETPVRRCLCFKIAKPRRHVKQKTRESYYSKQYARRG